MMILSILCATTPDREPMFTPLYNEVMRQITYMQTVHPSLGRIEVLVDDSPRFLDGGLSIGAKREALLKRASGKYLCYLDSDENIAPNYVEVLVRLCSKDCDVCTFKNLTKTDTYWTIVDMSLNYHVDDQASPNFVTRRKPWHVCPVKSVYAKMVHFPDTNYGEDAAWMNKVLEFCTTEAKSEAVIHCYVHSSKISESDKITQHELQSVK